MWKMGDGNTLLSKLCRGEHWSHMNSNRCRLYGFPVMSSDMAQWDSFTPLSMFSTWQLVRCQCDCFFCLQFLTSTSSDMLWYTVYTAIFPKHQCRLSVQQRCKWTFLFGLYFCEHSKKVISGCERNQATVIVKVGILLIQEHPLLRNTYFMCSQSDKTHTCVVQHVASHQKVAEAFFFLFYNSPTVTDVSASSPWANLKVLCTDFLCLSDTLVPREPSGSGAKNESLFTSSLPGWLWVKRQLEQRTSLTPLPLTQSSSLQGLSYRHVLC